MRSSPNIRPSAATIKPMEVPSMMPWPAASQAVFWLPRPRFLATTAPVATPIP